MRFLILACALLSAGYVQAAAISVQSAGSDKPAVVVVQGTLAAADGKRFFTKIAPLTMAVVRFQSNGGSVVTGIQIGEMIRLKDFHTLVPAGARCASACALAWLGGTHRFMGPGARIGLHAASDPKSGQGTGVGDALLGAPYSSGPCVFRRHLRRASSTGFRYLAELSRRQAAGHRGDAAEFRSRKIRPAGADRNWRCRFRGLIRAGPPITVRNPQRRPGRKWAALVSRVPRRGRRLA